MRDLNYTIIEKRISRLERLIANEQLNQKNEFLGLGKKKPTAEHSKFVIDVLNEEYLFEAWKKDRLTRGWKDESGPGYIDLSLNVNNGKSGSRKVSYRVTLEGRDLKKIKLNITRSMSGKDEAIVSKVVSLVKPDQIRKVADIITDNIDRSALYD